MAEFIQEMINKKLQNKNMILSDYMIEIEALLSEDQNLQLFERILQIIDKKY